MQNLTKDDLTRVSELRKWKPKLDAIIPTKQQTVEDFVKNGGVIQVCEGYKEDTIGRSKKAFNNAMGGQNEIY